MINIKCFHCGKSFALDEALASAWLEEHQGENPKHYPAQCHFCRRVIKVPIRQIQREILRQERSSEGQAPEQA
jgi:DNA-directed RNA polymerase subunit N (RpoN/RPB10)